VPLPREVFGDQNVAGPDPSDCPIAYLDIYGARQGDDRITSRRVVPGIGPIWLEPPDEYAASRQELGDSDWSPRDSSLGSISAKCER